MSNINPNDPVVEMLKTLVNDFKTELVELETRVDESLGAVLQENQKLFLNIISRLAALEARVYASTPIREDTSGKEL